MHTHLSLSQKGSELCIYRYTSLWLVKITTNTSRALTRVAGTVVHTSHTSSYFISPSALWSSIIIIPILQLRNARLWEVRWSVRAGPYKDPRWHQCPHCLQPHHLLVIQLCSRKSPFIMLWPYPGSGGCLFSGLHYRSRQRPLQVKRGTRRGWYILECETHSLLRGGPVDWGR